ncbi:MAG: hypothetical protein U0836_24885 [Pirellulales bacterium]
MADWPAWVRTLATRRRPKPWAAVLGDSRALVWDRGAADGVPAAFAKIASDSSGARLATWVGEPASNHDPLAEAHSALEVATALVGLAPSVSANVWQAALRKLLDLCQDAAGLEPGPVQALAAVELPLTLAQAFPELALCQPLTKPALRDLEQSLVSVLDSRGMPGASWWADLPLLVASWTRSRKLSAAIGAAWPTEAESRWRALLPQLVRVIRPDRGQAVSGHAWQPRLLEALIETSASARSQRLARENWGLSAADAESARPPSPVSAAFASEESQCAVLWSDWSPKAARLTVAYAERECRLDLSSGAVGLFRGAANPRLTIDGRPLALESDWEQICWQSDADVDYLELEVDLSAGWRVQRHLLLARRDRFLLLADAVLGERPAGIEYELALPLGESQFQSSSETTEGWILSKRRQFSVLPLALPEWQSAARGAGLSAVAESLVYRASARGQAMFAPLLFDLDSTRSRQPLTWRQLTVAASRVIQKGDVAVGYRAQLGRQQWMVYRSLGERANRTLLGHNTAYEFVVGRFLRTGHVDTLLQIE